MVPRAGAPDTVSGTARAASEVKGRPAAPVRNALRHRRSGTDVRSVAPFKGAWHWHRACRRPWCRALHGRARSGRSSDTVKKKRTAATALLILTGRTPAASGEAGSGAEPPPLLNGRPADESRERAHLADVVVASLLADIRAIRPIAVPSAPSAPAGRDQGPGAFPQPGGMRPRGANGFPGEGKKPVLWKGYRKVRVAPGGIPRMQKRREQGALPSLTLC
jgi:hypothetical protein